MVVESTMNAIGNAHNPNQGSARRALCVCSAGLLRSPTIASILHKDYGFNVRAAGAVSEFALVPVSQALLEWAHVLVFAEPYHFRLLEKHLNEDEKMNAIVLNVPDKYSYNDNKLCEIIRKQLKDKGIEKYL